MLVCSEYLAKAALKIASKLEEPELVLRVDDSDMLVVWEWLRVKGGRKEGDTVSSSPPQAKVLNPVGSFL
jgi:hypothetical protein